MLCNCGSSNNNDDLRPFGYSISYPVGWAVLTAIKDEVIRRPTWGGDQVDPKTDEARSIVEKGN